MHHFDDRPGRSDRARQSRQPADARDLPGLMRRSPDHDELAPPPTSATPLPARGVPAARTPPDDRPGLAGGHRTDPASDGDADGRVVSISGHLRKTDSYLPQAGQQHDDGELAERGQGTRPQDDQDFRMIADGMAITPRITVVLPVLNEAANLPGVFATLPGWISEVVLVDGRSTDDTVEVARRLRRDVKIVVQGGAGKGDALVAGFAAATGDIIVAIDGDGSTDGREIVRFVGALLAGADFAKGSRFSSSGGSEDITAVRRCGNKVLNLVVNRLFGTSFSDLCYGYNAFWSCHLSKLALDSPGFEIETLMSIRAARAGLDIHEVPSRERPRRNGASNLSALRDGWRILRLITQERRAAGRAKARRPRPFMAPGRLVADGEVADAIDGDRAGGRPGLAGVRHGRPGEAGR